MVSADEKTSIQARHRCHPSTPVGPGRPLCVEHEYERRGAWAYLAAWDVHHARLFGRCEARNGIAAYDRLVEQVMTQEPYRSARRVFWVTDNGSAHRGAKGDARLQQRWANHSDATRFHGVSGLEQILRRMHVLAAVQAMLIGVSISGPRYRGSNP